MTSFQSSELTELPVVKNSLHFAQRAHSGCTARARCTVRPLTIQEEGPRSLDYATTHFTGKG